MQRVPRILAITPPDPGAVDLKTLLPQMAPHVGAVLLRWPRLSGAELLQRCRQLAAVEPRPPLLVRDRVDVALLAGLDGVQLTEDSIDAASVRGRCPNLTIGVSRHGETLERGVDGADYVLLGTAFTTASKPGRVPLGAEGLRRGVEALPLPVVAVGGITPETAAVARAAGCFGIAAVGWIWRADPLLALRQLAR